GPTHQPVEAVAALRAIPNLDVIRPADPAETAGAFAVAFGRNDGPTLLALSRQNLPTLREIPEATAREGVLHGAYVARKESATLGLILIATGSELQWAMAAADKLGAGVRVVSMPCMERFKRQPQSYCDEVLPPSCEKRISIEAGATQPWYEFVGMPGRVVGIDRFGLSAPGGTVMKELGISTDAILDAARALGVS
ncbi:MAG: transketolase-like TK C-terminal-containing protein, partial [Chthoniobacterales bacterium]